MAADGTGFQARLAGRKEDARPRTKVILVCQITVQESRFQPSPITPEQRRARAMKKAILILTLVASFISLIPISLHLANPFFTYPFRTDWRHAVLLIWPDHVEARWFHDVSEVSPRPKNAPYTFNVAPNREAWVKEQVRKLQPPNGNASWIVHIQQLGESRQRIQLELMGAGILGIVYEATPEEIIPKRSRLAGPAGAFIILTANLLLWSGCWLLIRLASRLMQRRRRSPSGFFG